MVFDPSSYLEPPGSVMSQAMIARADIRTLADLRQRLGGIPLERIWFHPAPGTATEKDVIDAEERENRLCELVDGTMVWLIDPKKRTASVFSTIEKSALVRADQALDGGAVLPGFVLPLSDLLDRGRRPRKG